MILLGQRYHAGSATRNSTFCSLARTDATTVVSKVFDFHLVDANHHQFGHGYRLLLLFVMLGLPGIDASHGCQHGIPNDPNGVRSFVGLCLLHRELELCVIIIDLWPDHTDAMRVWTVTAAGRGQLRAQPLSRLRKYVEAYNIKVNGAIEKDDYIDHIIRARVGVGIPYRGGMFSDYNI